MSIPKLVEPGMQYFMAESLKKCRKIKYKYYSLIFNIAAFIFLTTSTIIFLRYKFKGKLSPLEKEAKLREQKYYIFSKIKQMEAIKSSKDQITNLPKWNNI